MMASLQAGHSRRCPVTRRQGHRWSTFDLPSDCDCEPSYYINVPNGERKHNVPVGKDRKQAMQQLRPKLAEVKAERERIANALRIKRKAERDNLGAAYVAIRTVLQHLHYVEGRIGVQLRAAAYALEDEISRAIREAPH